MTDVQIAIVIYLIGALVAFVLALRYSDGDGDNSEDFMNAVVIGLWWPVPAIVGVTDFVAPRLIKLARYGRKKE